MTTEGDLSTWGTAHIIDEWARKRIIPYIHLGPRFYLYDYDAVLTALRKKYGINVA